MKKQGIYYTAKGNGLHMICTKWQERPFEVSGIGKAGKGSMLVTNAQVKSSVKSGTLTIMPPALNPGNTPGQYAWVFKSGKS